MEVLAIIPARGGSKGISRKNIRLFGGVPLIVHTIKAALQSKNISRVIVSTEDEEIARIAKTHGAEVPFLRPKSLAKDNSEAKYAIVDLLQKLKIRENYTPEYIIALQPTSPLRETGDIEKAIHLFKTKKADSLVSVCRTENLLMSKNRDEELVILNRRFLTSGNRQKLSQLYKLDGSMIYLTRTEIFLKYKSFFAGRLVGYEIDRWRAVDLDEPQDFVLGEILFKNRKKINKSINQFK